MLQPLIYNKYSLLTSHFKKTENMLSELVNAGPSMRLDAKRVSNTVYAELIGGGCEKTRRNMGGREVRVAPIMDVGHELWAWLGYREEWDYEKVRNNREEYIFNSASLTIYFGLKEENYKPQMFRAEWVRWGKDGFDRSAGEAGHPHWHFDALKSLHSGVKDGTFTGIGHDGQGNDAGSNENDMDQQIVNNTWDLIFRKSVDRIHFASAGYWWGEALRHGHAHSPERPEDLREWLRGSISYLSSELNRVKAHRGKSETK